MHVSVTARRQPRAAAAILARGLLFFALAMGATTCGSEPEPEPASQSEQPDPGIISSPDGREWRKLSADGLHDPNNDLISYLQQPAEALGDLPPGGPDGNKVNWAKALRSGAIQPRTNVWPETNIRVLDLDIVFTDTAGQPHVVFPHKHHTEWLDCSNCHPKIFIAKRGANDFGMYEVLQGEYCGRCHGAVSFPLTECTRCHSRDPVPGKAN